MAAHSGDGSTGRHHCFFVEPFPNPAAKLRQVPNMLSINLSNTTCPVLVIPETPPPLTHVPSTSYYHELFHTDSLPWLTLLTFLKSLKGQQNPNKQLLASGCPVPLVKGP